MFKSEELCFFDFTLLDENYKYKRKSKIEAVIFSLYEVKPIALYFEKVNANKDGLFHLHAYVSKEDIKDKEYLSQLFIHRPIEDIKQLQTLSSLINDGAYALSQAISELKTKSNICIIPPSNSDKKVIIPFNCSYSQDFFAKAFMLREHTVINQIVSPLGITQYQVPINECNEELLLLTCGKLFFTKIHSEPKPQFGKSLINQDITYLVQYSSVLKMCNLIEHIVTYYRLTDLVAYHRFNAERNRLKDWIKTNTTYFLSAYKKEIGGTTIRWRNEYKLYQFIKMFFDDAVFQFHASWLGSQSFDIYIPSKKTAIEYQGQQHYNPILFFGGLESLEDNRQRDAKKRETSEANGVSLYEWAYTDAVSFDAVLKFLSENFNITYSEHQIIQLLKKNIPFRVGEVLNIQLDNYHPDRLFSPIAVYQCSLEGEVIQEFQSIRQASIQTNIEENSIRNALHGKQKTAGGYIWMKKQAI